MSPLLAVPIAVVPVIGIFVLQMLEGKVSSFLAAAVAVAAAAFLLTNPYSLLSLHDRLAEMEQIRRFYAGPISALAPLDYLAHPLREGFGLPFILAACGLGIARLQTNACPTGSEVYTRRLRPHALVLKSR